MFKQSIVAAVAVFGIVASASGSAASKPTEAPATASAETNAKTRYCLRVEATTGSIVAGRVCKTAAQWRADGVDPTRLQPKG